MDLKQMGRVFNVVKCTCYSCIFHAISFWFCVSKPSFQTEYSLYSVKMNILEYSINWNPAALFWLCWHFSFYNNIYQ